MYAAESPPFLRGGSARVRSRLMLFAGDAVIVPVEVVLAGLMVPGSVVHLVELGRDVEVLDRLAGRGVVSAGPADPMGGRPSAGLRTTGSAWARNRLGFRGDRGGWAVPDGVLRLDRDRVAPRCPQLLDRVGTRGGLDRGVLAGLDDSVRLDGGPTVRRGCFPADLDAGSSPFGHLQ